MRARSLLVLICTIVLVASVAWCSEAGAIVVWGTVTDTEGNAVADASVRFAAEDDPSLVFSDSTDLEGRYTVMLGEMGTSVGEELGGMEVPRTFALLQNAPNPFNPSTVIRYDVPVEADLRIMVYNILGQPIRTLLDAVKDLGRYAVRWDGRDDRGHGVSAGVYLCRMEAKGFAHTRKMVLLDGVAGGRSGPNAPLAGTNAKGVGRVLKVLQEEDDGGTYTVTVTAADMEPYEESGVRVQEDAEMNFTIAHRIVVTPY